MPVVHVETAGQWVFHLTVIAWQHRDVVYRDLLLLHVYSQFCLKTDTFGMGPKCPSERDVCLMESKIRGVKF